MGASSPLRIALTVHHPTGEAAGVAGSTQALAAALTDRGHDVEVLGFELLGRVRGGTRDALAFPHALSRELRRRLEADRLDVVDASTGDLAYVSRGRVTAASCAFFTRSHGLEQLAARRRRDGALRGELDLRWRYRAYHGGARLLEVRRSLTAADGVLLLNDAEVTFATDELHLAPTKIWRTAPLVPALPAPQPREPRDVLVLGPDSWRKGGDVALRVVERLLRADPARTASWHGLDEPAQLSARLGADVRSRFACAGRYDRQELATVLASHRVLLCCSRSEGLPVTLLEAISTGAACVGTDVPGVRDVLGDGVGLLAPDGDVDGLVAAAESLLDDDGARRMHAERARVAATSPRWRADAIVDRLCEAYRSVLAVKRPGR